MSDELRALQRAFLDGMRGLGDDRLAPALGHGRMPAGKGLAIYRHAYSARLREALEVDHPALGRYLGDAAWAVLCEGYIASHPSRVRSLRRFGEDLPAYLASTPPFAEAPQVAELAALERCLLDCFDAADAAPVGWDALLAVPADAWPGLRPVFLPSLRPFRGAWNAVALWSALREDDTPPAVERNDRAWLLWRDEERITRFRSMADDEALALAQFLEGGDFAGACSALLALHPEDRVPAVAIDLLRRWCDEGLVTQWWHPGGSRAGGKPVAD
jgi:hypothetical protein